MGIFYSKSKYNKSINTSNIKCNYQYPTIFHSQSSMSLRNRKIKQIYYGESRNRQRFCKKKKALILGLDGVGKTDFFMRLTSPIDQSLQSIVPSKSTIGKRSIQLYIIRNHCFYIRIQR